MITVRRLINSHKNMLSICAKTVVDGFGAALSRKQQTTSAIPPGLVVFRSFIKAMGGSITATNRIDGLGAGFTTSPVPVSPRVPAEALP